MFVLDRGDGPAVVLVPGLGADHTMYAPQIDGLTGFRRLAVDLRGTGRSPSLEGVPRDQVLATQAEDLATMLRERGVARAHLVGISYGGVVVETFLLRNPELAASAVICDSLCDTRPRDLVERLQMAGAHAQPAMLRLLPPSLNRAAVRLVYARRWPEAGLAMERAFTRERLADLILQRRVVNAVALEDDLRKVTTPTLCLVGDHSRLAVSMMRRVHAALPHGEFGIIADSFDPSSLCQPEEFTERIRDWVTRHEADGAVR